MFSIPFGGKANHKNLLKTTKHLTESGNLLFIIVLNLKDRIMKIQRLLVVVVLSVLHIWGFSQIQYEGRHDDGLKSFQLDNGEMKYARYHKAEQAITIYNLDHSEWKTVLLPIPKGQVFDEIKSISANVFNTDTLIELAYACVEYRYNYDIEVSSDNVDIRYTLSIVNEEGQKVFEAANGTDMEIIDSNNTRKLLVYKQIENGRELEKSIDVYALPENSNAYSKLKQFDETGNLSSGLSRGI
jgi:hypothetical protein